MNNQYYMYISTLADWDPPKTIFLCGPSEECHTVEAAEAFAKKSGWQREAEYGRCVLIVPVVEKTWKEMPADYILQLYNGVKRDVKGKNGHTIWGRGGTLWLWEVILFAAGYKDGAEFVGNFQIAYPNVLAAAALVNGAPTDFSTGEAPSCHWLVPNVSEDYAVKNREIPVHTWLYVDENPASGQSNHASDTQVHQLETEAEEQVKETETRVNAAEARVTEAEARVTETEARVIAAVSYWNRVNGASGVPVQEKVGRYDSSVYYGTEKAEQVRVLTGHMSQNPHLAAHMLEHCFNHVIRWKNSPDGTLALVPSREEFYHSDRYLRRTVGLNGNYYDYFVHLPEGMTKETVKGMPLVITVHGRGEPAWMFTDKNGWETLADTTKEFVTISPDSPGNIWFWDRDAQAFPMMIRQMAEEFGIDEKRVYLTGFSNGGSITREVSAIYPELFAGISPWNGPALDSMGMHVADVSRQPDSISPEMQKIVDAMDQKVDKLPTFIYYGDKDAGISVKGNMLMGRYMSLNHCEAVKAADEEAGFKPDAVRNGENYYTKEAGYTQGERFTTYVYNSADDGLPRVCVTVMKNMPHGAVREESRAAWEFLKHFSR